MAGRIFISYRRADTAGPAGWLYDRLAEHFGRPQLFKDLDSIQPGDDFAEMIAAAVASCDVLLALIGNQWLTAAGADGRRLADPDDFVRQEIESALTRGVRVIPVLVDGARMPGPGELPPSLAGLLQQQPLPLGPSHPDADVARLMQVLDQNMAETQSMQASPVHGQPTVSRPQPPGQVPPVPSLGQSGQRPTRLLRRRRTRTVALVAGGLVVAAVVAFIAIPGSKPASSPAASSTSSSTVAPHHDSASKAASSASPAASPKTILVDDFSTEKVNWVDDSHQAAGAYTGTGAYRLSVTGADGQSELARPAGATHGLGDVTPLNLSVSVDASKIAGAAQGYGYGIAFRGDGGGDLYAFVLEDHAVAIQKWVGGGARVADSPDPVTTSAVHADGSDRLQAVCETADGGKAVHLELWLNGQKLVDFTDHDHPYTKGYLGLFVESISDAPTTAGAEFDNFTAAQL